LANRRTSRRKPGQRERGVALILVLTAITVLTAVSVDFSFNSRVDLELATNARDELRAYYLARSSVNLSRLILKFQKQLDSTPTGFDPSMLMSLFGGGGMTPPGSSSTQAGTNQPGSGLPPGSGGLPIRLWQMIPVDCSVLQMLLAGAGSSADPANASLAPAFGQNTASPAPRLPSTLPQMPGGLPPLPGGLAGPGDKMLPGGKPQVSSFGDFEGCFHAEMEDEDQKINVNRLDVGWQTGGSVSPLVAAYRLFADPRFAFVFDREDANHVKMTPFEVAIAMVDWIDLDDTQESGSISPTGQIQLLPGFGDENRNYSHYPHPYRSKNNRFDSLDELYQVDGVSDEFMAAFRSHLTVYSDINDLFNINTDDPIQQIVNITVADSNQADPKLQSPVVMQTILQDINMTKSFLPFFGLSVAQYQMILQRNGITVSPFFSKYATDKSNTFTIHATGTAGRVEKSITAVVNFKDPRGLGRLVHYHED
jgi:general secretion pathway protein K